MPQEKDDYYSEVVGTERFVSDIRQMGALLLFFSAALALSLLNAIVILSTPTSLNESIILAAACVQFVVGVLGVVVAYRLVVYDSGNRYLTLLLMCVIQLSWFPFTAGVIQTALNSNLPPEQNTFIPAAYNPLASDVHFVGSMAIISIPVYAFLSVGPAASMAFSIHSYQVGKPESRPSLYYRSRAFFYNILVVIGGLSQTTLGTYILARFGFGPLKEAAPITAGFYVVTYPEITLIMGILQTFFGYTGLVRAGDIEAARRSSGKFRFHACLLWVFMTVLQVLTQTAGNRSGSQDAASWATTLAGANIGFAFLPPFLDYKMVNTPEEIKAEYYGQKEKEEEIEEEEGASKCCLCC